MNEQIKPMRDLKGALSDWQELLGPDRVITEDSTLQMTAATTFATTQQVPAVICPGNRDEVQSCVRIANRYRIPIYPISTGKNWGYGSRVPVRDECVVMELSRLNRIVDFDENLAYVTLEPGVTQQHLFEFLQEKKSNLFMSATGAPPDSSLIGNVLERGLGEGPYGDRFEYVCGMEVVLPTGECIHTGFGRFPEAKSYRIGHWGVGPYFDGLFTQSNLGIVTQMTVWLTPKPEYFQAFYYSVNDDSGLEGVVNTLRYLKLNRLIETAFVVGNEFRALPLTQQYPWDNTGGKTPLPENVRKMLRDTFLGGSVWSGTGSLYSSSRSHGRVVRRLIKQSLGKKVDRIEFFDEAKSKLVQMKFVQPLIKKFFGFDAASFAKFFFDKNPQRGIPITEAAGLAYWRKRMPVPSDIDPDRDKCGLMWCSPLVPFEGTHVRNAVRIMEDAMIQYQFEPNIGLNCATERSIIITTGIVYDREIPGEDQKASECYHVMLKKLTESGYIPYRLGIHSMDDLPLPQDDYGKFHSAIKRTLDPNDILSPGRYDFRSTWSE
ncbi:MAG: FAD-binding oxidoreductase [Desulfobacteraceae bacterium]|nr:FAD-binding oxidoreductase [Desulfobacteraceae bacterium]